MGSDGVVWVKLVQQGVQDSRVTQIRYQNGGSFIVDDLCKAAKAEFVQLPANVAASQLSVSATRDGEKLNEDAIVESLPQGAERLLPLYIHAPAPSQGENSAVALEGVLRGFLQEQWERDERQRKEQQERDERQRKEQQERDERQRKEHERQRKEHTQMLRHLARPENPWAEMARTSAASDTSSQQGFRSKLCAFYGYTDQSKAKCIVTDIQDDPDGIRVAAAHIWPKSAAATFPFANLEDGVHDQSNGVFLHKSVELDFDRLRVCFVCNPFDYSAVFLVLQESMLEKGLPGTTITYQDLHKKRVQFSKQERPCFQLLSRHATQAFDYPGNAQWMGIEEASFRRVLQVGSPQKQD